MDSHNVEKVFDDGVYYIVRFLAPPENPSGYVYVTMFGSLLMDTTFVPFANKPLYEDAKEAIADYGNVVNLADFQNKNTKQIA